MRIAVESINSAMTNGMKSSTTLINKNADSSNSCLAKKSVSIEISDRAVVHAKKDESENWNRFGRVGIDISAVKIVDCLT